MAGPFDLDASYARARQRLAEPPLGQRKGRSDRGALRLPEAVLTRLAALLGGQDHPGMCTVQADLQSYCAEQGLPCPSRATLYKLLARQDGPRYPLADMPAAVREALYNQDDGAIVPGPQLVFYCFNYGSLAAIHFAAGLPWLALYQAYRLRGWRPKSRGLLKAVLVARGIARA